MRAVHDKHRHRHALLRPISIIGRLRHIAVLVFLMVVAAASVPSSAVRDELSGKLLVATNQIGDPRFAKTVIFMLEHNDTGAIGLVVNRPVARWSFQRLLKEMGQKSDSQMSAIDGELDIFYGGPVEPQRGFVLHSLDYSDDHTRRISDFSGVTTSRAIVQAIAEGRGPQKFLFVFGYAGWGAGQLEGEIERRSWISVDADELLVLGDDHNDKWHVATARRGIDL